MYKLIILYDFDSLCFFNQRIQYAKTKSDCLAKEDGTFVPRDKRKKQEEKGSLLFLEWKSIFRLFSFYSSFRLWCWNLIVSILAAKLALVLFNSRTVQHFIDIFTCVVAAQLALVLFSS